MLNKPVLFINVGIPGSGKSTFCRNHLGDFPIVSRDTIRFNMLEDTDDYFSKEDLVYNCFVTTIANKLKENKSCVADATHLNEKARKKLIAALAQKGCPIDSYQICFLYFDIPLETCQYRNAKRIGREFVPEDVVRSMYKSLTAPTEDEFPNVFHIFTIKEGDLAYDFSNL